MMFTDRTIKTLSFVPSDWFVKFDMEFQKFFKTRKSVRITKLLESSKPICEFENHILALKRKRESNPISFKSFIRLDSKFVRMWSFLIGDGNTSGFKIRAYNTEPQPLINFVKLLRDYGYNSPNVYVAVPKFVDASHLPHFREKWAENLQVPPEAIRVRKEHERYKDGRLVKSDKECVEVLCSSDTLAWIFSKLGSLAERLLPNSLDFQKAHLQGIFSAEGSVVNRKKNNYRAVLIDMKNKSEIKRIAEFLSNFGIIFNGPKKSNGAWYIHITNRRNLEKLTALNIFALHPSRKRKLEKVLKEYKRRQAFAHKKNARFLQIIKILDSSAKTAKEISKYLCISLIRAQVLLKYGHDRGLWQRRRLNGSKSPYIYCSLEFASQMFKNFTHFQ